MLGRSSRQIYGGGVTRSDLRWDGQELIAKSSRWKLPSKPITRTSPNQTSRMSVVSQCLNPCVELEKSLRHNYVSHELSQVSKISIEVFAISFPDLHPAPFLAVGPSAQQGNRPVGATTDVAVHM